MSSLNQALTDAIVIQGIASVKAPDVLAAVNQQTGAELMQETDNLMMGEKTKKIVESPSLTTEDIKSNLQPAPISSDSILNELFGLPEWPEWKKHPASDDVKFKLLKLLTDLSVLIGPDNKTAVAPPKVLIIRQPEGDVVETTSPVNLVVVQLINRDEQLLQRVSLEPLPEEEFYQLVCDTLATELQEGRISMVDINKVIEQNNA